MAYGSTSVVIGIGELGVKDRFPAFVVQALVACTATAPPPWHFGPGRRYGLCIRHDRHIERVPQNLTSPFAIIGCSIPSLLALGACVLPGAHWHDAHPMVRMRRPEERGDDRCSQQDEGQNEGSQAQHLEDYIGSVPRSPSTTFKGSTVLVCGTFSGQNYEGRRAFYKAE
jgi:hypothetical protein